MILTLTRNPPSYFLKRDGVFMNQGICNPPITNEPKLIAGDCKSPEHKEVGTFFDDGLQIRRNA